ncbi:MAG: TonB-dependent receptor [Fibrobacter sp.]|jgi:outer membrane receptor for ferrienterochelin and colicins|nr:TonB-dependent receptor [Fibrobacter sp.]
MSCFIKKHLFFIGLLLSSVMFFSHSGHAEEKNQVQESNAEDLFDMELDELLNITVTTASKSKEKLSDAPGVLSVVTRDDLERFGATSLKDVLLRVPSLMIGANYMTDRSMITSRGDHVLSKSGHILYLLNGRPIREVLEGGLISEVLESFPVNSIDHIEVIRGPGSVLYGTNAFSAVINIITIENSENVGSGVDVSGGRDAFSVKGNVGIKDGDLSILASMRYAEKRPWHLQWKALALDENVYSQDVIVPDKGPGAYVGINYKNLNLMYSFTKWETFYGVADFRHLFPSCGIVNWSRHFANAGWEQAISEKWRIDFNFTYTGTEMHVSSWPGPNRKTNELLWELTNSISPLKTLNIILGAVANYSDGSEHRIMPPPEGTVYDVDTNRYCVGFYAQADWRFIEKMKLIAGIQANKVEFIDVDVVPRVGLIVDPLEFLNFKLLYSQAFRAPFLHEMFVTHPQMHGSRNLVPEKVNTVDIGANLKLKNMQGGINGFYSKQKSIIIQDRSDPTAVPTYNNFGEVIFMGLELDAKYYIIPEVYLTASMLYQSNKDQNDIKNVVPSPNFSAKGGLSYMADNGISMSLFNVYQGDMDKKYYSSVTKSPKPFSLLNFYGSYNINKILKCQQLNRFDLYLNVENILDKEIWLTDWNLQPGKTLPDERGRIISGGVHIQF